MYKVPVYAIGTEHQPNEFGMWAGPHPDLKEMLNLWGEKGAVIWLFMPDGREFQLFRWDDSVWKWKPIQ